MSRKPFFLLLILLGSTSSILCSMTLEEAAKTSIMRNPSVSERNKYYNTVIEDMGIVKSSYYPTIDLYTGAGLQREEIRTPTTHTDTFKNLVESYVELNQNLFDGYKTEYELQQNKARLEAAGYSYLEQVNAAILGSVANYLNVLRNKALLDVEKEAISFHRDIYGFMRQKQQSGFGKTSDLEEIRTRLALATTNTFSAENNLKDEQVSLHKSLGKYVDVNTLEKPEFVAELPVTLQKATEIALENNPSMLVAKHELDASTQVYRAGKNKWYPSIDLNVRQTLLDEYAAISSKENTFEATLEVRYNLFSGTQDSHALQKLISQQQQQSFEVNRVKRDTVETLHLAWNANQILSRQVEYFDIYLAASEKRFDLYQEEFNAGTRTLLDLLGAYDDLNNARREKIENEYDLLYAKYRILDGLGSIAGALKVDPLHLNSLSAEEMDAAYQPDILDEGADRDRDGLEDVRDICANSGEGNLSAALMGCSSWLSEGHTNGINEKELKEILLEKLETENNDSLLFDMGMSDLGGLLSDEGDSVSREDTPVSEMIAEETPTVDVDSQGSSTEGMVVLDKGMGAEIGNILNPSAPIEGNVEQAADLTSSETAAESVVPLEYTTVHNSNIRLGPWGEKVTLFKKNVRVVAKNIQGEWAEIERYQQAGDWISPDRTYWIHMGNLQQVR